MKDPFTSDKDRFLVLGSKCSVCSRLVCVGPRPEQMPLPFSKHSTARDSGRGWTDPTSCPDQLLAGGHFGLWSCAQHRWSPSTCRTAGITRRGKDLGSPTGMQFILLQEVLPPLCPGEHGRLPSGNPARLGEKESSIKEAGQPAWLSDMSAPDARVARAPCTELWGRAGSRRAQPCSGTGRSSVCNWSELGPSLPQEGDWEMQRRHSKGRPWTRHPADPTPYRALSKLRLQGRN
ncbi:cysteine-rich DPF motif domain-containing protein 1 isoform X3 [Neovison vison]|nr:cysteine-rich DPF motif domain-containing protein 1 isoform X3 [Neogale vison]XP_044084086.1 cysteine-rich DPF motif domain-containing protein 1 isoform X3 [Neogale vison]